MDHFKLASLIELTGLMTGLNVRPTFLIWPREFVIGFQLVDMNDDGPSAIVLANHKIKMCHNSMKK